MNFALTTHQDGSSTLIRADGSEVGVADSCQKMLHLVPTLVLDKQALAYFDIANVRLEVISDLAELLVPKSGIQVSRPYPNHSFVVGGSADTRNGWCVDAALLPSEFDVEYRWTLIGGHPEVECFDWVVRHRLSIKLLDGKHRTYTMAVSNWPRLPGEAAPIYRTAQAFVRQAQFTEDYTAHRQIRRADESMVPVKGSKAGLTIEEAVEVPSIPYEQAINIHAYQDKQLHELEQTSTFSRFQDEHKANGSTELPAATFLKAVSLARAIPYKSRPRLVVTGDGAEDHTGRLEQHPALVLLSQWWEENRPDKGSSFRAGMAMPYFRALDDGDYQCGYMEFPSLPIGTMFSVSTSCATCGDALLIHFLASVKHSHFEENYLDVRSADGEVWQEVGVTRDDVKKGLYDEAWNCLDALAGFPTHFPVAYLALKELASRQATH